MSYASQPSKFYTMNKMNIVIISIHGRIQTTIKQPIHNLTDVTGQ
jgi:hypothetical protein